MSYEIFANHAHVFPENVRPDGTVDCLLRTMDACAIARCVCFATFPKQLKPENDETNAWLAQRLKGEDRLIGFGVIDFERGSLREQVDRIADLGFKGIKLHPAYQKFAINGENAFEVYRQAEERGLFLSFHTGVHWHRIRDYQMLLFDEVAYNFPQLRFSMEHIGGYCFFNEGVAVMINNRKRTMPPRIYAGLTSVFDRDKNRLWNLSDEKVRDLIWLTGDDASIFGLDFPYNGTEKIKEAIAHLKGLQFSQETEAKLFGGNLKRALGL